MNNLPTFLAALVIFTFIHASAADLDVVPQEVGDQILASLEKAGEIKQWNDGFATIHEVDWTFVSLAGPHSRKAEFKEWFLFPYWNTATESIETEPKDWRTGFAVRKGSNVLYSWTLTKNQQNKAVDAMPTNARLLHSDRFEINHHRLGPLSEDGIASL